MSATARALVVDAMGVLSEAGLESPAYDAESLLAWVLGTNRSRLALVEGVAAEDEASYRAVIGRRAAREPLQHILGSAAFRYVELEVGPGVFVPRPETEVMTGVAIDELRSLVDGGVAAPNAIDLCTGSGAIALAMVTEVPQARVSAVELSREAFAYAERNLAGHDVDLRLGDISNSVNDLVGVMHVVTVNPPYIPLDAYESVALEARDYDPALALWSGDDGLDLIKVVEDVAARLLVPSGLVACEHADVQGESAPAVFASTGRWTQVRDNLDLAGRPRFVTARRV